MMRRWVPAASAMLAAVAAVAGLAMASDTGRATAAPRSHRAATALVERRTLVATVAQAGVLSYRGRSDGSPYFAINRARGTYTELPPVGRVITEGHVLYRVDDRPVLLLYGDIPLYRTLSAGATGRDVAQLNADLVALGYAAPGQLDPTSTVFGPATAAAVEKLQAALGLPQTGTLSAEQALFEPTRLRVTALTAQPGSSAQIGQAVLAATSTVRQVQVALGASQQTHVAVGDRVTVTLPDNRTTPGVVSSVGAVATCPSGPSGSGSAAPAPDACAPGSTPTVSVGVTPTDAAATGTWDQAPVQVGITTARVPHALVVPVTALLARSGGGNAVEVVGAGGRRHLVAVSLGLFDDAEGLVAVTGSGLAAGQRVVVAGT